jgi:hypothetical protein
MVMAGFLPDDSRKRCPCPSLVYDQHREHEIADIDTKVAFGVSFEVSFGRVGC